MPNNHFYTSLKYRGVKMEIEPWRWDNLEPSAVQKYGKKKQTCSLTLSGKIIII